jgi:hypothetical protein
MTSETTFAKVLADGFASASMQKTIEGLNRSS